MTRKQRRFVALAGVLVAGALLLRIYRIGDQELWIDEAFSFYVATIKTGLGQVLLNENNPPLYYLLLRSWVSLFGTSEAALRLPSAIFGTLFVATVIWVGATFFDRRVGLWAGAFAAIAPIHIYYSQEARPYTLLILLVLLTYVVLWRALARDTWPLWALVSVVAALAVYSHYIAVLGLLPTAMLVWIHRRDGDRRIWRRYGAATVACGLLVLPWVAWSFALNTHSLVGWDWITMIWNLTPPALAIPKTLEVLGLGSQAGFFPPLPKAHGIVSFPLWLRLLGIGLLLILAGWVAIPWMDQRLQIGGVSQRKGWLWVMLFFPVAALWLISFFLKPIYFVGRHDFIAFPAYSLLAGLGLAKFQAAGGRGRLLGIGLAAALCVPIGDKLIRYYEASSATATSANTARLISRALFQQAREGDVAVFTGLRGIAVVYYLDRLGVTWSGGVCEEPTTGRRFGCRFYPQENEDHPGVDDPRRVLASSSEILDDTRGLLAGLRVPTGRLWLAFSNVTYSPGSDGITETLWLKPEDAGLVEVLRILGFRLKPSVGALLFEATRDSPG